MSSIEWDPYMLSYLFCSVKTTTTKHQKDKKHDTIRRLHISVRPQCFNQSIDCIYKPKEKGKIRRRALTQKHTPAEELTLNGRGRKEAVTPDTGGTMQLEKLSAINIVLKMKGVDGL